jgi:hypothetical protein
MSENLDQRCPECDALTPAEAGLDRRLFMKAVGGTAVTLAGLEAVPSVAAVARADEPATPAKAKPAEALVRELYTGLSEAQRRSVVLPWNHGATATEPATRLRFYNSAALNRPIGNVYTPAQRDLIERIVRSIASGEDGFAKLSRGGTWDNSGSLQNCGAAIFGTPTGNNQYCFLFTGHHLTVRCDGNSEPDAAFGGPMYYGHSPDGYSRRNIFNYQTRSVVALFDALSGEQQTRALRVMRPNEPGELLPSVRFRDRDYPGLPVSDLAPDQRALVRTVMRTILDPYRREDADEVMELIGRNGGMERIHLAFYRDQDVTDNHLWHFWRLEGPGFVWNYRVLPHVHTYVNIALRPQRNT